MNNIRQSHTLPGKSGDPKSQSEMNQFHRRGWMKRDACDAYSPHLDSRSNGMAAGAVLRTCSSYQSSTAAGNESGTRGGSTGDEQ